MKNGTRMAEALSERISIGHEDKLQHHIFAQTYLVDSVELFGTITAHFNSGSAVHCHFRVYGKMEVGQHSKPLISQCLFCILGKTEGLGVRRRLNLRW
jgi:hypothetical protein